MIHLVRHGRSLPVPGQPPHAWELDPAGFDDVWALRESGRLPTDAVWFCSPEPKAVGTAQLLTEQQVGVIEDLREHVRETADWIDAFPETVAAAFARPEVSAYDGWEPLVRCRQRLARVAGGIVSAHPDEEVVLVGHGTAWTLLAAVLTGAEPDLDRWREMTMPDVLVVPHPGRSLPGAMLEP